MVSNLVFYVSNNTYCVLTHSHFADFEQIKKISNPFAEFEQVKKISSHFADLKQLKDISSHFSDFKQFTTLVVKI